MNILSKHLLKKRLLKAKRHSKWIEKIYPIQNSKKLMEEK